MLPRNIIVCADGTGNKGGSSPDSNVYRVYKMVDKYYKGACEDKVDIEEQILFYDNGIGTSKNSLVRAVTAGIGIGFKHNVCDLYKFLSRNYVEGDRIYFFGFSRGASTVRACNGMISICGLAKSEGLRNCELDKRVEEAYVAYKNHKTKPELAENFKNNEDICWNVVPIKFLGVWDTVVALGFPKRTGITGPLTLVLNILFAAFEKIFDFISPHSFYHYKLTDNVEYACQALAIDDERTAFWPYVWQEKNIEGAKDRTPENVQQVWFTGMHANVGGGYERDGLAGVPLHWLMKQAQKHGLMFNSNAMLEAHETSHVHGRMYNSRLGLKMIYRYHPREIEKHCKDKLLGNIKIHESVIDRMYHRTANYVPGHIPASFDVVDSDIPANVIHHKPGSSSFWDAPRKLIDKLVNYRKRLYGAMLAAFFTVLGFTIYYWNNPVPGISREGNLGTFAEILDYFTLDMFDGLIDVVIVQEPRIFQAAIIFAVIYYFVRRYLLNQSVEAGESLRHVILAEKPSDSE